VVVGRHEYDSEANIGSLLAKFCNDGTADKEQKFIADISEDKTALSTKQLRWLEIVWGRIALM
jgi:hypothetical protein